MRTEKIKKETGTLPYMMFPKFLMDIRINETAKLLYMVLLDRSRLSAGNAGWTDKEGNVFICYTVAGLEQTMHKRKSCIEEALKTLEEQGLIQRKRLGAGRANHIYVKLPSVLPVQALADNVGTGIPDIRAGLTTGKADTKGPEKRHYEDRNGGYPMTGKAVTNKNNKSKNELIRGVSKKGTPCGRYGNVYLSDEDRRMLQKTVSNWQDYVERLSSYMASTGKQYQDHAATIIHWAERDGVMNKTKDYSYKVGESL